MHGFKLIGLLTIVALGGPGTVQAGLSDWLDALTGTATDESPQNAEAVPLGVSQTDMIAALKQALEQGVNHAVQQLGQPGGFLNDARVRIPMPEQLAWTEATLRKLGQDRLADEFVESMNEAAEQAVPEVASVFGDAIRDMTLEDARGILEGPDDAATRYFQTHSSDALAQRMLPIISEATSATGVTAYYKSMMSKTGGLSSFLNQETLDLDNYVTHKAMDGLFLMIAEQEKLIRENPLERSTELLQKVFGAL